MHRNAIYILVLITAGLTALGLVMLSSTGAFAHKSPGDYFFLKRQCAWLGVALVAAVIGACVNYNFWKKIWPYVFGLAFVLLILCFVPHVGMKINGSYRWINLGICNFQPSELAKLAAILFIAWWFSKFEKDSATLLKGFIYPMAIVGLLLLPIAREQDLGYTALIGAVAIAMMYLAGMRVLWMAPIAIIGLVGIMFAATCIPERMARLLAFLDPEGNADKFYQQLQGLIAFGSGGIDGLGLGNSRQKMDYLPFAHTDFIFPMIGEELGLVFTLLVVFSYLLICLCGCLVAMNARDRFGMLLGFGLTMMVTLQAVVNIGVTTALLPNKGMPLPFISFGGSNLAICYFMIGILINIHCHGHPLVETVSPALKRVRNFCRL
ncbi:putative lipid II flippase FtsW [soil metagenome]